jgi:hypothetical protein
VTTPDIDKASLLNSIPMRIKLICKETTRGVEKETLAHINKSTAVIGKI